MMDSDGEKAVSGTLDHAVHRQSLQRHQRLTRTGEFRQTYAQGRRWVGRDMVLWLRTGEGTAMRLGVVASKKVGNAVCRARAKRRLRSLFRIHRELFDGDVDVVLVARRAILKADWEVLERELLKLSRRAGIYSKEEDAS